MSLLIYTELVNLYRLENDVGDSNKENFALVTSQLAINIQPMQPQLVALSPYGDSGKLYTGYTICDGIKEGMIIERVGTATISGMRLRVTGVEEWRGPLGLTVKVSLLQPKV